LGYILGYFYQKTHLVTLLPYKKLPSGSAKNCALADSILNKQAAVVTD
jgi:hypothetical protein